MKTLIFFVLFPFLFLAQSKSLNIQHLKDEDNFLFPLKFGNCWYNERIVYNDDGSISSIKQDSIFVKKDTLINSTPGYFFSTDPNSVFYQNKSGLWVYVVDTKENSLFLKYPCALNDSWKVSIEDAKGDMIVKNLNEVVKIKNKSYDCIHYELLNNGERNSDIFIKPSIGFIKVILYKNNHKNMEVRLINFNIK